MTSRVHLKNPNACTNEERGEFARLIRQGFPAAQNLEARIRAARWLAFYYAADGELGAIAALKAPGEEERGEVFRGAEASAGAAEYEFDLGWVFVAPAYRRSGVASSLCRSLLTRVPAVPVFARTRTDNVPMQKVLRAHGFVRHGQPHLRRDEELVLFLRPDPVAKT